MLYRISYRKVYVTSLGKESSPERMVVRQGASSNSAVESAGLVSFVCSLSHELHSIMIQICTVYASPGNLGCLTLNADRDARNNEQHAKPASYKDDQKQCGG